MEHIKKKFQEKYREFDIPVPEVHFVMGSLIGLELNARKSFFPEWKNSRGLKALQKIIIKAGQLK